MKCIEIGEVEGERRRRRRILSSASHSKALYCIGINSNLKPTHEHSFSRRIAWVAMKSDLDKVKKCLPQDLKLVLQFTEDRTVGTMHSEEIEVLLA